MPYLCHTSGSRFRNIYILVFSIIANNSALSLKRKTKKWWIHCRKSTETIWDDQLLFLYRAIYYGLPLFHGLSSCGRFIGNLLVSDKYGESVLNDKRGDKQAYQIARSNYSNLLTGQPRHQSHWHQSEMCYTYDALILEEGGWGKGKNKQQTLSNGTQWGRLKRLLTCAIAN